MIPNTSELRRERVEHARHRIALLRDRRGGRPLVLSTVGSVAWATGGLSVPIDRVTPLDPVWVVVQDESTTLVVSSVEVARLRDENELASFGFSIEPAPWYEPDAHRDAVLRIVGATFDDCLVEGADWGIDVSFDLVAARLALCGAEIEVLDALGRAAASAVEEAVKAWRPGRSTDFEVASDVQGALERTGMDAVCLIVGGDERVRAYRHPVMVGSRVDELLMVVVVARSQGLHVAVTRIGAVAHDERLAAGLRECDEVRQFVHRATRVGASWGDAYEALGSGYRSIGRTGAWREHFQGGPIGYAQREFELSPEASSNQWWSEVIEDKTAVAWNPSVAGGAKLEDTFIVDSAGMYVVTDTGKWPRLGGAESGADVLVV